MKTVKAMIFLSGNGSNFQNIIDNIKSGFLQIEIFSVISDNKNAYGLERAKKEKIETMVINSDNDYENIEKTIIINSVDIIILAGYMKILPASFVNKHIGKILNIHPSLLPKYKGLNTHRRVIDDKEKYHGASVHFVTPDLDNGPIIIQGKIEIKNSDTENTLKDRVHKIEHEIYPLAIKWLAEKFVKQDNDKCLFNNEVLTTPIEHI
jgi:phosphoribosylglycinamide formyltransferase-1|tara:strand:- start:107 stop:730 length:624 start_codon:yes stop_codon:yes gene_type:complete